MHIVPAKTFEALCIAAYEHGHSMSSFLWVYFVLWVCFIVFLGFRFVWAFLFSAYWCKKWCKNPQKTEQVFLNLWNRPI